MVKFYGYDFSLNRILIFITQLPNKHSVVQKCKLQNCTSKTHSAIWQSNFKWYTMKCSHPQPHTPTAIPPHSM